MTAWRLVSTAARSSPPFPSPHSNLEILVSCRNDRNTENVYAFTYVPEKLLLYYYTTIPLYSLYQLKTIATFFKSYGIKTLRVYCGDCPCHCSDQRKNKASRVTKLLSHHNPGHWEGDWKAQVATRHSISSLSWKQKCNPRREESHSKYDSYNVCADPCEKLILDEGYKKSVYNRSRKNKHGPKKQWYYVLSIYTFLHSRSCRILNPNAAPHAIFVSCASNNTIPMILLFCVLLHF